MSVYASISIQGASYNGDTLLRQPPAGGGKALQHALPGGFLPGHGHADGAEEIYWNKIQ